MKAKFYTEIKDKQGKITKKVIKNPRKAVINPTIECEWGNKLIDDISTASVAVSAKRAKLVVESTRDIGRPQMGLWGSLAGLFGKKDEEMDTPEEVPVFD